MRGNRLYGGKRAAWVSVFSIFSLMMGMMGGVQPNLYAAQKKTMLVRKKVKVCEKDSIAVAAKNVAKGTKVSVKQTAQSKKLVKAVWKSKSKKLVLTGKKEGNCQVQMNFRNKGKRYSSILKVTVSKRKLPGESRKPDVTKEPDVSRQPVQTEEPVPSPTAAVTAQPTNPPEIHYDIDNLPIKDVYKDYFLVGAAINGNSTTTMALRHEGMADILKKHFNSTVMSNLMKPENLLDKAASKASKDGMPVCKFHTCDEALQFCMDHGIKMRGHTLVWHNQVPKWFFFEDYDETKELVDADTMEKRLESYIKQVITHCQDNYPGVVYCWDVVNECVSVDKDSYIVTKGGWKLRASTLKDNDFTHEEAISNYYYATMGEEYVEKAFAFARKYADKDVKLFYNDYNVFMTEKMNNIYMMARELKEKGLIDGIGLQPTVLLNWPELDSEQEGSFRVCLETYVKLNLELQVTELSFKIDGKVTESKLKKQAARYEEFMRLLMEMDSENGGPCNITSVTVFGICDDYPLYEDFSQNLYLWDKMCNPKPCLYGFVMPGLEKMYGVW